MVSARFNIVSSNTLWFSIIKFKNVLVQFVFSFVLVACLDCVLGRFYHFRGWVPNFMKKIRKFFGSFMLVVGGQNEA